MLCSMCQDAEGTNTCKRCAVIVRLVDKKIKSEKLNPSPEQYAGLIDLMTYKVEEVESGLY